MRPLVLRQILLAEEALPALQALKRPGAHLVRLLVRLERVLRREVLPAQLAHVRPHASMRIDMLVQQIPRAVPFPAYVAGPRLVLRVVHPLVDPEQAEVVEDAVADLALEVALLRGDVLVHVEGELVALAELLAANVADVEAEVVFVLHVRDDGLGLATDGFRVFRLAEEADVHVSDAVHYLKLGTVAFV